jgi:hypothetical protein
MSAQDHGRIRLRRSGYFALSFFCAALVKKYTAHIPCAKIDSGSIIFLAIPRIHYGKPIYTGKIFSIARYKIEMLI